MKAEVCDVRAHMARVSVFFFMVLRLALKRCYVQQLCMLEQLLRQAGTVAVFSACVACLPTPECICCVSSSQLLRQQCPLLLSYYHARYACTLRCHIVNRRRHLCCRPTVNFRRRPRSLCLVDSATNGSAAATAVALLCNRLIQQLQSFISLFTQHALLRSVAFLDCPVLCIH